MVTSEPCNHLDTPDALDIEFVLDAQLYPTSGFLRCKHCDARLWFELDEIDGADFYCRLSTVPADAVAKTIRSLNKGSCDLNRAGNEVFSLRQLAEPLPTRLLMRGGAIVELTSADQARS